MSKARCPTCDKPVPKAPPDRPESFPFCSERCKLIDLGKWFNEEYRVSTPIESPEQVAELLEEEQQPDDERDAAQE